MSDLLAVRIGMQCSECMGPVPINRIDPKILCQHCLSPIDISWPKDLFRRCWTASPREWPVGKRDFSANLTLAFKIDVERIDRVAPETAHRDADGLVQSVFPGSKRVYNESVGGDPTMSSETLVFACMSCGGGLKVDGTSRVVVCTYCKDSNFLPDALWLRMHPALKRKWLVIEY